MSIQRNNETPNPEYQAWVETCINIEKFIAQYEEKFIKPIQIIKPIINGK